MAAILAEIQLAGSRKTLAGLAHRPGTEIVLLTQRNSYLRPFLIVLAIYCLWVLSLPVFPTQDGAMHLYYVHALHRLAAGDSLFTGSYALRSPLPPYTFQYAILYALTSVLDPVWAEKTMVCLILITTATGFRSLSKVMGDAGALVSLWIFLFALSWAVCMGFHNFCLSLGLSLWALTFWLLAAAGRRKYFIPFCCSIAVVVLTHPVPLLMLLGCLFVDLCIRVGNLRRRYSLGWKLVAARLRPQILSFAAALSSVGYLALFLNARSVATTVPEVLSVATALKRLLFLQFVCFGAGNHATAFYRLLLAAIIIVFLSWGWKSLSLQWHARWLEASSTMMLCSLALIVLLPLLPSRINGLDYFRERLLIYVFLFGLASVSAYRNFGRNTRAVLHLGALLFAGFHLAMADSVIRPVAQDIAQVENLSVRTHSRTGLILNASRIVAASHMTANPYYLWSAARYFRRFNMLILNDPWAGPPNILPLDRNAHRSNAYLTDFELLNPSHLYRELLNSKTARDRILSQTDFLFFVGFPKNRELVDPLLGVSGRAWACRQGSWFFFCEADGHAAKTTIVSLNALSSPVHPQFREVDAPRFQDQKQQAQTGTAPPLNPSALH